MRSVLRGSPADRSLEERHDEIIKPGPQPVPQRTRQGTVPRVSRLMALAIRFDDLIRSGATTDQQIEPVAVAAGIPALVARANELPPSAWTLLPHPAKYVVQTEPRTRPANVRERIVQEKGYQNLRLLGEDVAALRC